MSDKCKTTHRPLTSLRGFLLTLTARPGVLRALRYKEEVTKAQGLNFNCPACTHDKDKAHGVTLLFDLENVPPLAKPDGRYKPAKFPCKLDEVTLGEVKSPYCKWTGWVTNGEVYWRP